MIATNIQFQPSSAVSLPCPVKKGTTQSQNDLTQSHPSRNIDYDNPLRLSKKAYAVQQNILSLEHYWKTNRLLEVCLTLREDLPCREAQRRLNSFLTNVVRPCSLLYMRVTGRTRKGQIHYHITVALAEYCGKRQSGKDRLTSLRRSLKASAGKHGFGRTTVARVGDIEGWSIYLARHIDQSRLRLDKKLRRVSYSSNFKRVCMPRFSWTSPFAGRWRRAVAEVAEQHGYKVSDPSRKWIWHHYREILERADALDIPKRDFAVMPRTVFWKGRLWTVLRLQEDPNLFVLQRPAQGAEQFAVSDPLGKYGVIYSTISEYMWRRDLQRIVNAERVQCA
jgi:hypothetical protein